MAERGDPSAGDDPPTGRGSSELAERGEPTLGGEPSFPRGVRTSGEYQSVHALGPGAQVGRFVLERKLGEGGMGLVFLARDPELERAVAVKVLRLDRAGTGDVNARVRMLREARSMAMLNHPNLVTIYEVGTLADTVFLAMEYVTGQSLHEWLETPRSVEDILSVFDQAGRGLGAMHDTGLVHRDFKPANVVVTDNGLVKVLDLGIARRVTHAATVPKAATEGFAPHAPADAAPLAASCYDEPLTRDGAIVGTPPYMPLEQILGDSTSPASDQFAFAVALFEALTGEKPFPSRERLELLKQVLAEDRRAWPPESPAPTELRGAIDRALSLYPEQRFESMAAFLDACWAAIGQKGPESSRWHPGPRPSEPVLSLGSPERSSGAAPTLDEATSRTNPQWLQRARRARWVRVALALLVLGPFAALIAARFELAERRKQLEQSERAELDSRLVAASGRVEQLFVRAEESLLFAYYQQRAWLPLVEQLAEQLARQRTESRQTDLALAERDVAPSAAQLNALLQPVVERTPQLRWLCIARNDGFRFFVLAGSRTGTGRRQLDNRLLGPELEQPVLELTWSGDTGALSRSRWSSPARTLARDPGFLGHTPGLESWFAPLRDTTPHVVWTEPYWAASAREPGARAAIAWNHRSQRYVLAMAIALTGIAEISTALTDARFRVFVTTRDHRLLGLPESDPTLPALSSAHELRESTFRAALAAEPSAPRTPWRFPSGDRTRWAGRVFLDRTQPTLSIYLIQAPHE